MKTWYVLWRGCAVRNTGMFPTQHWVPLETVTHKPRSEGQGGGIQVKGRRQYSREEPEYGGMLWVRGIGNASNCHRFSFGFLWGKNNDHSTRHYLSTVIRQCSNAFMPFSWLQCHHQHESQETHHAPLSAAPQTITQSHDHTLGESSGTNSAMSATLVNVILISNLSTVPHGCAIQYHQNLLLFKLVSDWMVSHSSGRTLSPQPSSQGGLFFS